GSEGVAAVYAELAEAGRWEDFRWLAESQGLARERIDALWTGLRAAGERPAVRQVSTALADQG
ncbi:MAG TPA: hypothetical protein VGD07_23820, partial [Methylomirabilota bacterium]